MRRFRPEQRMTALWLWWNRLWSKGYCWGSKRIAFAAIFIPCRIYLECKNPFLCPFKPKSQPCIPQQNMLCWVCSYTSQTYDTMPRCAVKALGMLIGGCIILQLVIPYSGNRNVSCFFCSHRKGTISSGRLERWKNFTEQQPSWNMMMRLENLIIFLFINKITRAGRFHLPF